MHTNSIGGGFSETCFLVIFNIFTPTWGDDDRICNYITCFFKWLESTTRDPISKLTNRDPYTGFLIGTL